MLHDILTSKASITTGTRLVGLKRGVLAALSKYEPDLGLEGLSWKGQLLRIATECALGVQYLHGERFWHEGGDGKEAGWQNTIIHR